METKVIQTPLFVTPDQYFQVEERVEVKLEYANGKIIPKEGSTPLPDWVVRELLKPEFDKDILNFEFPMATPEHSKIVSQLHGELYFLTRTQNLDLNVYSQGIQVMVSLGGKYRIPDVLVSPSSENEQFEKMMLTNPIAIFEVLSDSTADKDQNEKLEEYLNIESLQEYFLVWQDTMKIERYRRLEGKRWEYAIFREGELPVSSVDVTLKLDAIYKDVF
ncbi:MAG: Uma2 family endonuclease [Bacteroidota bacterium]